MATDEFPFPPPSSFGVAIPTFDGTSIPWIDNWEEAGTFPDDTAPGPTGAQKRAKQIAANLIDYCDSDIEATTDYAATAASPPVVTCTYTGNDKTPYINQVVVKFNGKVLEEDSTDYSGTKKYTPTVAMPSIYLETCNMYDTNATDVTAEVTIAFTYNWVGGPYTFTEKTYKNIPIPGNMQSYQSRIETVAEDITPGGGTPTIVDNAGPGLGAINGLNITKLEVKLTVHDPGPPVIPHAFADFSFIAPNGNTSFTISPDGSDYDLYVSYEVDDPRQNLNYGDWAAPVATSGPTPFAAPTPDTKNSVCNPTGAVYDVESATAMDDDGTTGNIPGRISTAYIRNAPMQSPWELGAIHRGAKWQTINLKEYNSDAAVKVDATTKRPRGGNKYTADPVASKNGGDANILDQIKMTSAIASGKKVSLKLQKNDILYALFNKIKIGDAYATVGTVGTGDLTHICTFPNEDSTNDLVSKVKEKNINFFSRACVAEVTKLFDGSCGTQNNDRQQEEIIGKFINLTNVSVSDYYTVIVLAQSIKDVGTTSGAGLPIRKDLNYDGTVTVGTITESGIDINGDGKTNSTGINEDITGCKLGEYDQYADEIVAEQKIKVELYRDPNTKKCTILRMEYLE